MSVWCASRRIAACGAVAGALMGLVAGAARAAPGPDRVAILAPDLAQAAEQAAADDLRARGFTIVPEVELYRAIERQGIREDTATGRKKLVRALRLSATLTITLARPGSRPAAEGLLRDEEDTLIDVWQWSPPLAAPVAAVPWRPGPRPAPVLPPPPPAGPPPSPPGAAAAAPIGQAVSLKAAAPAPHRPDVLALSLGPRLLHRRLAYAGVTPGELTDFATGAPALALGVRAEWFPLWGMLRGLGVVAQLEQARAVRSQTPVGDFVSPSSDYAAAAQWRHVRPRLDVAVDLGAGLHRFDFQARDLSRRLPRPLPGVAYQYLQAGLELRVRASERLAMLAGGHYRHVLRAGAVTSRDWFPGAGIRGLDASAGLELRLGDVVTAAAGVDARLYHWDLRPSTSGRLSAGANDNYYSGWFRLGFRLGTTGT